MKKIFAIIKREYLQAVKKKMFIIMTLLMPFLMAALIFIPALLMLKTMGGKTVAVVDGSGRLKESIEQGLLRRRNELKPKMTEPGQKQEMPAIGKINIEYVAALGKDDLKQVAAPYLDRLAGEKIPKDQRLDAVILIPADAAENSEAKLTYYSKSATDMMTQERISGVVNRAVQRERFASRGVNSAELDRLLDDLSTDAVQISKSGEEKKGGDVNFILAFVFILLLLLPVLIYGQEVMRGIIQEKSDRIVEILISSVSPMQLLTGKILGLAAVGLTQLTVWVSMAVVLGLYAGGMAMAAGKMNVLQFIRPDALLFFLLFFILGYLTYVCVYAVGGAMVNTEKEAQQLLMPIILVLMVPYLLFMPITMNPDSTLATVISLIPIYTPIAMFVRVLVSEPPVWQVVLSIVMSILTIIGMFWIGAKIFRVGILSYGKRPTIPELWRWMKVA